jgi:hypothetical protein
MKMRFSRGAQKTFNAMLADAEQKPTPLFNQLMKTLDLLAENPQHPSLHTHKHHNYDAYEAYINKSWRVFFDYTGKNEITILLIT